MKKTTKVLALLATALMAFAVVGCKNPGSDPKPQPENNPVVILNEPKEIKWSEFCIVEGSKFTGTEPKTISIYYDCVAVEGGQEGYTSMKIAANYEGAPLGDGEITGGTLKADDKGAIEGTGNVGENGKIITYKPTSTEWTSMTSGNNGLYINGNNIKITKITLK